MGKFNKIVLSSIIISILILSIPISAFGILYKPPINIANPAPSLQDFFGRSVSMSGNNVLVGAPRDLVAGLNAGTARLFDGTTGVLLRTFNNPSPAPDDNFGHSVSVSSNRALVGAPQDDIGVLNSGAAYLFDTASGALLRTFNNPFPAPDDNFGHSVAISGNNVLVGAPQDDIGVLNSGAAYLFDSTTGALLRIFNNPSPAPDDNFGHSVAISGNNVLIGTPRDDTGVLNSGAAYLFDSTTGALLRTFNNPSPAPDDNFGHSVAVSGSSALVGAHQDDIGALNAGSAYRFDTASGVLLRTFNNPSPASNELFGTSVAVSGNNVLVGSSGDNVSAIAAGAAHLFDGSTGVLLQTFNNPTPVVGDGFGQSVSVSGNSVLVGAHQDDTGATDAGFAYLFLVDIDADGDGFGVSVDCNDSNPAINPAAEEVCDGIDNNCDGSVDDGNPGGGAACNTGLLGVCSAGTTSCSSGSIVCSQNTGASPEQCNGLDDDCDGSVDDGNPGGGGSCSTGLGGVCDPGTLNCSAGSLVCGPDNVSSEICDGTDNNCDGSIDEGGVCVGSECGNGIVEAGEQCDDGNTINGDGCSSACMIEVDSCGDGVCDPDVGENTSTCSLDCTEPICGNGFCEVDFGENAGNCPVDCGGEPVCGNGVCEVGETTSSCPADCGTTDTGTTTGLVEIVTVPTCGLIFLQGAPIQYGQVTPFALSSVEQLLLDNPGNALASLFVRGSHWLASDATPVILVGNTHYSTSPDLTYNFMTSLTPSDSVVTENFTPDSDLLTLWQMRANLEDPDFTGSASQTMDFTASC